LPRVSVTASCLFRKIGHLAFALLLNGDIGGLHCLRGRSRTLIRYLQLLVLAMIVNAFDAHCPR
jgi:hypothetical protein